MPTTRRLGGALARFGARLDAVLIKICAALVAAMVLIVWFGVVERYGLSLGVTWTEELSRYVMIWAALLAVPVGVFRRDHIGFELLFAALPAAGRKGLRVTLDLIAAAFFGFLAWFGIGMTIDGAGQYATIFGMTMMVPFASVPVSAALALVQTVVVLVRDLVLEPDELPGAQLEEAV